MRRGRRRNPLRLLLHLDVVYLHRLTLKPAPAFESAASASSAIPAWEGNPAPLAGGWLDSQWLDRALARGCCDHSWIALLGASQESPTTRARRTEISQFQNGSRAQHSSTLRTVVDGAYNRPSWIPVVRACISSMALLPSVELSPHSLYGDGRLLPVVPWRSCFSAQRSGRSVTRSRSA